MKRKKPSERMTNRYNGYFNDDEDVRIMKRMIRLNMKSAAEYIRKLVLEDIRGIKP
jgi:hypothetical protein